MTEIINGISQDVDPRVGTCVVGEVKTGSTFFAGEVAEKTGSGTQTLSDANDTVAAGYYEATTLSTIDAHLVAGNILKDVVLFGVTGTVEEGGTLAEDELDEGVTTLDADSIDTAGGLIHTNIGDYTELIVATCTLTVAADSMVVAVGFGQAHASTSNALYYRLYIDGNIVATEVLPSPATATNQVVVGTHTASGEIICKLVIYNDDNSEHSMTAYAQADEYKLPFAIGVGSVKST